MHLEDMQAHGLPNDKVRPMTQAFTVIMALSSYGLYSKRAYAALNCPISDEQSISDSQTNSTDCSIDYPGILRIEQSGSLSNLAGATLTNNRGLLNFGNLLNSGTVINNYTILTSQEGVTTNLLSGTIVNNGGFDLEATFNNEGSFSNANVLNSNHEATIGNIGEFNNLGEINHLGTLNNLAGATFVNEQSFVNNFGGVINNQGHIVNNGLLDNVFGASIKNLNDGVLTNNGSIFSTSDISNSGSFTNNNTIDMSVGLFQNSGLLTNYGAIRNTPYRIGYTGAQWRNDASGTFINENQLYNYGTFNNAGSFVNSGQFTNLGSLTNNGTVEIASGASITTMDSAYGYNTNLFTQQSGVTSVNGSLVQSNIDIQGGILAGVGTVQSLDAPLTVDENATIAPGNSVGSLIVGSDLALFGTLDIEISQSDLYDVLQVEGDVLLSPTTVFNFIFDSDFSFTDDFSVDFLFAETISNIDILDAINFTFKGGSQQFSWNLSHQFLGSGEFVSLDFVVDNAVSNSAPLMLIALGLPILAYQIRRQKLKQSGVLNKSKVN